MVTVLRHSVYGDWIHDVRCLSTDTKPTDYIKNGSTCIEIDTGTGYLFNADSGQWVEQSGGTVIVIPTATGVNF